MKKIKITIMILFVSVMCLVGCIEKYDKGDIRSAARAELGHIFFIVSSESYAVEDENGYTDNIWTIKNLKTGVVFHVIDDHGGSIMGVTNSLKNDYDQAVIYHIYDDLPEMEYLDITTFLNDYGRYEAYILGDYTNEGELQGCYTELVGLKNVFSDLGYEDLSIWYEVDYEHLLRTDSELLELSIADTQGNTNYEIDYEEMINKYIQANLFYRYDEMNNFTEYEIETALVDYDDRVGIYIDTEEIIYYDNIIANGLRISYGSLYEILKREGYDVSGDVWHYTFTGIDGVEYEISYEFADYEYENGVGYYYIADGEKTPMDAYFRSSFYIYDIKEMTGLELVIS